MYLGFDGNLKSYSHFKETKMVINKLIKQDSENKINLENGLVFLDDLENYVKEKPNAIDFSQFFTKYYDPAPGIKHPLPPTEEGIKIIEKYSDFFNLINNETNKLFTENIEDDRTELSRLKFGWNIFTKDKSIKYYNYLILFPAQSFFNNFINFAIASPESKNKIKEIKKNIDKAILDKSGLTIKEIEEITEKIDNEIETLLKNMNAN
ncbi:hypothetical protein DA803_02895 [[Mycoplasma] phocae]|uniref:Uncharacterized protein n=1 Tax=[Mycoplasma] phocae TaxID=142651 RepID=A0A2Z5IRM1_9BACT|nr:hypothetical protein [[Mycoplasma] phocae]AXE61016.1 hypothetical protein DA803_02895 [[Mycoplasma] phocae]